MPLIQTLHVITVILALCTTSLADPKLFRNRNIHLKGDVIISFRLQSQIHRKITGSVYSWAQQSDIFINLCT